MEEFPFLILSHTHGCLFRVNCVHTVDVKTLILDDAETRCQFSRPLPLYRRERDGEGAATGRKRCQLQLECVADDADQNELWIHSRLLVWVSIDRVLRVFYRQITFSILEFDSHRLFTFDVLHPAVDRKLVHFDFVLSTILLRKVDPHLGLTKASLQEILDATQVCAQSPHTAETDHLWA